MCKEKVKNKVQKKDRQFEKCCEKVYEIFMGFHPTKLCCRSTKYRNKCERMDGKEVTCERADQEEKAQRKRKRARQYDTMCA